MSRGVSVHRRVRNDVAGDVGSALHNTCAYHAADTWLWPEMTPRDALREALRGLS